MNCQFQTAVAEVPRKAKRRRAATQFDVSNPEVCRQARLAIELAVARVFGIEEGALWRTTRGVRNIAMARQVAMYLAHVACGLTLTEVGALFGRDRTTVAHACMQVELKRDNANFDRALDLLGWAIPNIVRRPHAFNTKL